MSVGTLCAAAAKPLIGTKCHGTRSRLRVRRGSDSGPASCFDFFVSRFGLSVKLKVLLFLAARTTWKSSKSVCLPSFSVSREELEVDEPHMSTTAYHGPRGRLRISFVRWFNALTTSEGKKTKRSSSSPLCRSRQSPLSLR
jgi:hypothetical protein